MTGEVQGDGSGIALPEMLTITKDMLREAVVEYIVQSRTGATLSYQTTAMMDADAVADSNTEHLWGLLGERAVQGTLSLEPVEVQPAQGAEFIAAEDIGAGQWVTFNEHGQIVALKTEPKATITLVDDAPAEGDDFSFDG